MERAWWVVSGLCLLVAALFFWRGNMDVAFVAGALGVVAWFLSLRVRLRKTIIPASSDDKAETDINNSGDQDEN
jgi:hypothetical protein